MLKTVVSLVPVASGKGGVGKSLITANLGLSLARKGKTVIMVDLDLGGSNLHSFIGVKNKHTGIGGYIYKQAKSLEECILPTEYPGLFLIPGDSLLPGTANLPFFTKQKIIKELQNSVADIVLLDLGAGSSYNTVDFFLSSWSGLIVTTGEPTSILNAYSFLKTAVFRLMQRSFPAKSSERAMVQEFVGTKIEGGEGSLYDLLDALHAINPESGLNLKQNLKKLVPRVVVNMGRSDYDLQIGKKLRDISRKNIGIEMEYLSFLPYDESARTALVRRSPLIELAPQSDFSSKINTLASDLISRLRGEGPELHDDDIDDL
jgi:flagellar biosynthesis protein FlhG